MKIAEVECIFFYLAAIGTAKRPFPDFQFQNDHHAVGKDYCVDSSTEPIQWHFQQNVPALGFCDLIAEILKATLQFWNRFGPRLSLGRVLTCEAVGRIPPVQFSLNCIGGLSYKIGHTGLIIRRHSIPQKLSSSTVNSCFGIPQSTMGDTV